MFFLAYRFWRNRQADLIILVFSIGLIIVCYLFNVSNPWYGSTICFWLGIKYYENEIKIKSVYLSKKSLFYLINTVILICSIFIFYVLDERNFWGTVFARNLAAASFSILIVMLLYKVNIGNAISNYLGKISYEVFLIHPFVIGLLEEKKIASVLYSCLVVIITIFTATLLHSIEICIVNIIRDKKWIIRKKSSQI